MTISKPAYPVYGYDTFTELQTVVDTLYANDEDLQTQITAGGGSTAPVVTRYDLTLPSNYGHRSGYVNTRTVMVDEEVHLETGLLNCPGTLNAVTYYTVGTVHVDHRPTDGANRIGMAQIYRSTAGGASIELRPLQMRLSPDGLLQVLTPVSLANIDYMILGQLTWSVV